MTAIGLHGGGMMAQEIARLASTQENIQIQAIVSRTGITWAREVPVYPSLEDLHQDIDVLVDFTQPGGLQSACQWCARTDTPLLSGTTGLTDSHKQALEQAARSVAVLWSANLSIGINLVRLLAEQAASSLGHDAEIAIEDIHHAHKKDAPSGTALMLAAAVASARGEVKGGSADDDIVLTSVRRGEEIGRHSVRFTLADEQIEISHSAGNRSIYAKGALAAADWLARQNIGLYTASDYLLSKENRQA